MINSVIAGLFLLHLELSYLLLMRQPLLSLSADYIICLFLQFSLLPASGQCCKKCSRYAHQTQIQVRIVVIPGEWTDIVVIVLTTVLSVGIRIVHCFLLIPVIEVDFLLGSGGPLNGVSVGLNQPLRVGLI